jgi:hypothetical protein
MPPTTSAGLLYWYTTSAVLGLLTIINIISKLWAAFSARRRSPSSADIASLAPRRASIPGIDLEKASAAAIYAREQTRKASLFQRTLRVGSTIWMRYILLSDLPLPAAPWIRRKAARLPATELSWTLGYTTGVLMLSFYGSELHQTAAADKKS